MYMADGFKTIAHYARIRVGQLPNVGTFGPGFANRHLCVGFPNRHILAGFSKMVCEEKSLKV